MVDTVKIQDKKQTKMIAHRGASRLERENTLPAFIAAGNRTYFGAECDIHVTTDGKYLVYHDNETERLCDKNLILEENDSETLRALRLKEIDSEEFSETLKIPTFEEYLAVLSRYGKTAVVELKNRMKEENIREVIDICKKRYTLDRVIFISFDFDNLLTVRKILPEQPVQFLTGELTEGLIDTLAEHKIDADIGWWTLSEEVLAQFHAKGVKVNCWTCDDPKVAENLIAWGVDYITSNVLE